MYNYYQLKRSFIRQYSNSDCAASCLQMILNFAGRSTEAAKAAGLLGKPEGASLLDLKVAAEQLGLSCKCVSLESFFLRRITWPCILLVKNEQGEDHFQVCYGPKLKSKGIYYLVADPAKHLHYVSEEVLLSQWPERAALYFNDLRPNLSVYSKPAFLSLLSAAYFPRAFWISVPSLSVMIVLLGIGFTWLLQKDINNPLFLKREGFAMAIFGLLGVLILAKSTFNYLRQYLIMVTNIAINEGLAGKYLKNIVSNKIISREYFQQKTLKRDLLEIHKIQNGISALLSSVLPDGLLVLMMTIVCIYQLPVAALCISVYVIIIALVTNRQLVTVDYHNAKLNELSGFMEDQLIMDMHNRTGELPSEILNARFDYHIINHKTQLNYSRHFATHLNKTALINDLIGAVCLLTVFCYGLWELNKELIDNSTFVTVTLMCYLITAFVPKICGAVLIISDGAAASVQFNARTHEAV